MQIYMSKVQMSFYVKRDPINFQSHKALHFIKVSKMADNKQCLKQYNKHTNEERSQRIAFKVNSEKYNKRIHED